MTKQEAVGRIYRWAFNTLNARKTSIMELLCARKIAAIYEASDQYDQAYDAIEKQILEWHRERREGVERVLAHIEPMMKIDAVAV